MKLITLMLAVALTLSAQEAKKPETLPAKPAAAKVETPKPRTDLTKDERLELGSLQVTDQAAAIAIYEATQEDRMGEGLRRQRVATNKALVSKIVDLQKLHNATGCSPMLEGTWTGCPAEPEAKK